MSDLSPLSRTSLRRGPRSEFDPMRTSLTARFWGVTKRSDFEQGDYSAMVAQKL